MSEQIYPKISVIICAYTMDRYDDTLEAVESVLAQTLKPHEVIISIDHNEELNHRFKTEMPAEVKMVLNGRERGLSETRNTGIRAASGDIIAFIDDDAIAEPNWLECLSQPFSDSNVAAVGGKAVPKWINGKQPGWFPEEFYWILGCTYKGMPVNGNKEIRNVLGCNMAFRTAIFERVGYFRTDIGGIDETPRGGEEADLCLKINQEVRGLRIICMEGAVIHHKVPVSRLKICYIMQRCYNDGFYKQRLQKSFNSSGKVALSTENTFLRYLLLTSLPSRVKCFYKKNSISEAAVIAICTLATGLGYLSGKRK